jgi:excinuclease ABC subunit C
MARVRDEAHRFAITYHRERRRRGTIRTSLTDIPGVGPTLARRLLNKYGSIARIRGLSAEDLQRVPGISVGLAERIREHVAESTAPAAPGEPA